MNQLINNGWKFIKLPIGSTLDQAMKEELWTDVDLPHDWLIWQADNLYESADAWYIRKLNMPDNLPPVCIIHFDGVYMDCDVLLNGNHKEIAEYRFNQQLERTKQRRPDLYEKYMNK